MSVALSAQLGLLYVPPHFLFFFFFFIPFSSSVAGRLCRNNRARSSSTRAAVRSNTNFSCEQQCCKKSRRILRPPVRRHAMRSPPFSLLPLGLRRNSISLPLSLSPSQADKINSRIETAKENLEKEEQNLQTQRKYLENIQKAEQYKYEKQKLEFQLAWAYVDKTDHEISIARARLSVRLPRSP